METLDTCTTPRVSAMPAMASDSELALLPTMATAPSLATAL